MSSSKCLFTFILRDFICPQTLPRLGVRQTQTAGLADRRLADLQTRSELTGGGGIIAPAGISPRGRNPEEAL